MSMPSDVGGSLAARATTGVPSATRGLRMRRILVQGAIVLAFVAVVVAFVSAVRAGLARHGVTFSFGYLGTTANFEISEGRTLALDGWWPSIPAFTASDTNLQALCAGLFNTLKVAIIGIVLSTVLGTLLGVCRLSTNWLLRQGAFAIVEFLRNTPLLIQLVFWYYAVVLSFPPALKAAKVFGFMASQQGFSLPALVGSDATSPISPWILCLAVVAALAGLASRGSRRIGLLAVTVLALGASIALGFPLSLDWPSATRFSVSGGTTLSPEMSALLLAIIFNSGSYIAEIVRGTIESTPRGQWEAASALGMGRGLVLSEIILPQVFRVVLPSFANQYISLTKNTALGIAIGFPDLFNVNGTISNQSGRSLEGVLLVMGIYLVLSWVISVGINVLNGSLNRRSAR